jgi:hypothetical protein
MARPTMLTRARHERIINLLRDGVPFATACREVGVSASAGYEWLYRGWGTHPDRPSAPVYVAFARAVDAVFLGGFAERHEDEFASVTERSKDGQAASFAEPQNRCETGPRPASLRPAKASESQRNAECAEPAEPDEIRHEKRTRARVQDPMRTTDPEWDEATRAVLEEWGVADSFDADDYLDARATAAGRVERHAPLPWESQRSRRKGAITRDITETIF